MKNTLNKWLLLFLALALANAVYLYSRLNALQQKIDDYAATASVESEPFNSESVKTESATKQTKISNGLNLSNQTNALPDFSRVARKVAPSVVSIAATSAADDDDGRGLGAGFFIDTNGHIITNLHVVENAQSILVKLSNKREYEAMFIGGDQETDIAVVKVNLEQTRALVAANSSQVLPGQWVLGVGAPFGFEQSVAAGIISAKRRFVGEQYIPYLQSDVAINQGNSGGPLVDLDGRIVGVNTKILSMSGGSIGLSFAVPIDLAMDVATQLIEQGEVSRGFLGVGYLPVDMNFASEHQLPDLKGARISQVSPDSPAAEAALQVNDVVLSINDNEIQTHNDLPFYFGRIRPGGTVSLTIWRDNGIIEKKVIAAKRPARVTILPAEQR